MQKIKIQLDDIEMNLLSKFILYSDYNILFRQKEYRTTASILSNMQTKFVIKNEQKSYTKKLPYFQASALAKFLKILLSNQSIEFTNIAILINIHQKIDTFL